MLVAYNFVQRNRPFQTKLNQKEMAVTLLQFSGTTWLQEATDDLSSQAMFSLLLVVLTDCFVRFRGAVKSRVSTTRAENVTQYLLITWRLGVYQRRFNQTLFLFLENKLTWLAGDFCQTCVRQWCRFVLDWIGYALFSRKTLLDNLGLLTIQCWDFFVSLTAAIDTPCQYTQISLRFRKYCCF